MSEQWSIPAWLLVALVVTAAAVLIALATVLLAVLPARRALAAARSESSELGRRLAEIEQRLAAPGAPSPSRPRAQSPFQARPRDPGRVEREFVITHLGDSAENGIAAASATPVVPPSAFLDLVLRETAVQASTLAIGLRRALSPESRNRIRFEMRREVKRARRQRRRDTRAARREWEARQRAAEQEPAA